MTESQETYQLSDNGLVTLRIAGELESVNSTVIAAPANWYLSYQILYLPDEGSFVAQGDTVVKFDTRQVENQYQESLSQLDEYQQELIEKQLTADQTMAELKNNLVGLQFEEEINLNRMEQAQFNSETDQQDAALELEKTRQYILRAKEAIVTQKTLNENNLNEVRLKIDQIKSKIELNRKMINDMYILSPKNGMVVYQKLGFRSRSSEKIKIGDTAEPQDPILNIPDLDNMKVEIEINEIDIPFVRVGNLADVIIEAYPDTVFRGTLQYISKLAENNYGEGSSKCYFGDVIINSRENMRLKPGLSAIVTLTVDTLRNVYSIPSCCLIHDENQYYLKNSREEIFTVDLIRLVHGNAFIRGDVKPGDRFIPN